MDIAAVQEHFENDPHTSMRRASLALSSEHKSNHCAKNFEGLEVASLQGAGRSGVRGDFASRFDFATDVLQRIGEDQQCLHSLAFSDEAHFHHDGTVNRHYYRYCRSPENPFELFFV